MTIGRVCAKRVRRFLIVKFRRAEFPKVDVRAARYFDMIISRKL